MTPLLILPSFPVGEADNAALDFLPGACFLLRGGLPLLKLHTTSTKYRPQHIIAREVDTEPEGTCLTEIAQQYKCLLVSSMQSTRSRTRS